MEAGEPMELSVGAGYDGEPFTGPVDIVLFPCADFDPTTSPVTLADADGILELTVAAPNADCANIVFDTARALDGLRLDAGSRPAAPFGVGQVIWQ